MVIRRVMWWASYVAGELWESTVGTVGELWVGQVVSYFRVMWW